MCEVSLELCYKIARKRAPRVSPGFRPRVSPGFPAGFPRPRVSLFAVVSTMARHLRGQEQVRTQVQALPAAGDFNAVREAAAAGDPQAQFALACMSAKWDGKDRMVISPMRSSSRIEGDSNSGQLDRTIGHNDPKECASLASTLALFPLGSCSSVLPFSPGVISGLVVTRPELWEAEDFSASHARCVNRRFTMN